MLPAPGWYRDLLIYAPICYVLFVVLVFVLTFLWAAISERRRP